MPHTLITWGDGLKYQTFELTAPGRTQDGASGKPWRGFGPSTMGRHWANDIHAMEALDTQGLIHWPKNGGFPRRRAQNPFCIDDRMVMVGDIWNDLDRINQTAKERLGYPTQKPMALLERIISSSSNLGDIVLDPFCGCGTAIDAAQTLGRRWIGIDITHLAITLQKSRLRRFSDVEYEVIGEPKDVHSAHQLAHDNRYQFQWWALSLIGARPLGGAASGDAGKKGPDRGIDGIIVFIDYASGKPKRVLVQVKSGGVSSQLIRDLAGTLQREQAAMAVFITLEPTKKTMTQEAAAHGFFSPPWGSHPKIQILSAEGLLTGKERIEIPPQTQVDRTFKKAGKVKAEPAVTPPLFRDAV